MEDVGVQLSILGKDAGACVPVASVSYLSDFCLQSVVSLDEIVIEDRGIFHFFGHPGAYLSMRAQQECDELYVIIVHLEGALHLGVQPSANGRIGPDGALKVGISEVRLVT